VGWHSTPTARCRVADPGGRPGLVRPPAPVVRSLARLDHRTTRQGQVLVAHRFPPRSGSAARPGGCAAAGPQPGHRHVGTSRQRSARVSAGQERPLEPSHDIADHRTGHARTPLVARSIVERRRVRSGPGRQGRRHRTAPHGCIDRRVEGRNRLVPHSCSARPCARPPPRSARPAGGASTPVDRPRRQGRLSGSTTRRMAGSVQVLVPWAERAPGRPMTAAPLLAESPPTGT
jgi:hypothetical protein